MKKQITMLFLVIVMIASFAGTTLADPTTQLRWEEPFYVEVDCGDYDIIIDDTARIALTLFSDQNNNPSAYAMHVLFDGTITNTATGSVLPGALESWQLFSQTWPKSLGQRSQRGTPASRPSCSTIS